MRLRILNIALLLSAFLCGGVHAAKEPKGVANARKSVVSILIYSDGELLRSGTGVFAGENGELFSSYSLFEGADSAVTIDAAGTVREVKRIIAADEIYDCLKARVSWDKKISPLPLATTAANEGDVLYLVSYGSKKSGTIEQLPIAKVDIVSGNPYYTFSFPMQERYLSAPVVNVSGELLGLMQPVAKSDTAVSYAVSAKFAAALGTTSLSYSNNKYKNIDIPLALPNDSKEALTILYLLQSGLATGNARNYLSAIADYNSSFPDRYEGHIMLAEYHVCVDTAFDAARKEWAHAIAKAENPDDVCYNISKTYRRAATEVSRTADEAVAYVDSALLYADRALAHRNEPLYILQKAELHHTKGDYAEAFESYARLSSTSISCADVYAAAAACKDALGDYDAAIAYMDSAVATFGSLPVIGMAPYIIDRAVIKHRAGRAREAVLDYNAYAELRGEQLNARFYFIREQAEYDAKMFQQALDDIDMAIYLEPAEVMFLVEKGRVCYRVKLIDEAVDALSKALVLSPENPDCNYMLARCYMVKGNKAEAKRYMQKAHELGHYDADSKLKELD